MLILLGKNSTSRLLVRRLLPAAILVPIVLGLLRLEGEWVGLYRTTVGTILFTAANVLIIAALILWSARLFDSLEDRRRQAQESLREAEERYRGIFESSVAGIYQSALDGRLSMVNPAMARMFGYDSPEDMIASISDVGRQLYAEPDQREEFVRKVREEGSVHGLEGLGRRKDGSQVWFSYSSTS